MGILRKSTLALAMTSTLLLAGVASASARSVSLRTFQYDMHLPPGQIFSVTYQSGVDRVESSSLLAQSGGAISRAAFAGDKVLLAPAIQTGRFSGELKQTLVVGSATLVGVARIPARGTVTLTNTATGDKIALRDGERFSIPTGVAGAKNVLASLSFFIYNLSSHPIKLIKVTGDNNFEGRTPDGSILGAKSAYHRFEVQARFWSKQQNTAHYEILGAHDQQIGTFEVDMNVGFDLLGPFRLAACRTSLGTCSVSLRKGRHHSVRSCGPCRGPISSCRAPAVASGFD